jgi:hypothetical protein
MLIDYSQTAGGLATGISQTFDGEHPCSMCKAVKKAKQEQAPQGIVLKLSELKATSPLTELPISIRMTSDAPSYFSKTLFPSGIDRQGPPLQPPRA